MGVPKHGALSMNNEYTEAMIELIRILDDMPLEDLNWILDKLGLDNEQNATNAIRRILSYTAETYEPELGDVMRSAYGSAFLYLTKEGDDTAVVIDSDGDVVWWPMSDLKPTQYSMSAPAILEALRAIENEDN